MQVSWWAILPFVAMLLSIAIAPLVPSLAHHWEKPRTQLGVALLLGLPVAAWVWLSGHHHLVTHALHEYVSFICLLGSLFIISGGIHLAGDIRATPRNNTVFLGVGAVLASFIGTTGAAMLLIRPILNTNRERQHAMHTVIYAIFVVANCGGLLTPLGDPPLFLGMLRGVPFTWTFSLVWEWLFINTLLLVAYFGLDTAMMRREDSEHLLRDRTEIQPLKVHGAWQLGLLAGVVAAVAFVPTPWREVVMVALAAGSWFAGSHDVRFGLNEFSWDPILEVAALFLGIFTTMITALQYLSTMAPKLPLNEITFYLFSGGLSSVLDNAPTYATFFELATQLPGDPRIANVPELYLVAISLGAVTCGALTYIGNGPNFMVRSVAESQGRTMPSFGGYIVWSLRELAPVLAAMVLLFIADPLWCKALGAALTLVIVGNAARRVLTKPSETANS
ncbi:MAG: sodium:proton antiporter [Luteococcus sp.]|uniref:sodium:proton antiporter n=1 Tax=Luteococcus sp. TaxID=1969402 RepID=UPI002649858E|nr:sodium:proton antiporter [Luteococcus sp.]MDN5564184.1 sodium:proton antiporter [Luteococcus sp.]